MKLLHPQNMKYKLVIFDFDGPIADTSPGILDSHRYALRMMEHEIPSEAELRKVIGGNLLKTYIASFGFDEAGAREAVKIYRERYSQNGIHEAILYPGFSELLKNLKNRGIFIGVATLKAEGFAKIMLRELGIAQYFDVVCGMDSQDNMTKAELISKCCLSCNVQEKDAVLVGDSSNDLTGAQRSEVSFIGVTYGFGFNKHENYNFLTADSPDAVFRLIRE